MINTWKCGICGKIRHDPEIDVITYPLFGFEGAEVNLKYCNDNDDCYNQAKEKAKTGKF